MNLLNRNNTHGLVVVCGAALIGAAWYFVFGWPTGAFPVTEPFAQNAPRAWNGSPWQIAGWKEIISGIIVVAVISAAAMQRRRWVTACCVFGGVLFLTSLTARLFPLGYGYDIFVHDATVRAWIEHGAITPQSPLYAGYYALVALLSQLTTFRPIVIMSWLVPLGAAMIIAAVSQHEKKMWPLLCALGLLFPPLFTTATPQALGHLLLFGYVMRAWYGPLSLWTHIIVVAGLFIIHPLSGIPALALGIISVARDRNVRWVRFAGYALACALPTVALILNYNADFDFSLLTTQNSARVFFNPHVAHQLLLYWKTGALVVVFAATLIGWRMLRRDARSRDHAALAAALAAGAIPLWFISLPSVISYEHGAFAARMLLAAALVALPLAAHGIADVWNRTTRSKIIGALWCGATIILIAASWYNAFEPWNTAARTRARVVTPTDVAIVRSIDADAHNTPYIVLADQISSAAALHEFGFTERRLPTRADYFYPVPTGAALYTEFFLPSMYEGITRERLQRAAAYAGVRRVYVVLKPYWIISPAQRKQLEQNTSRVFDAGGAFVGRFDAPLP